MCGLAVFQPDDQRVALYRALGGPHAGHRLHRAQQRRRDRLTRHLRARAAGRVLERLCATNRDVHTTVHVGEQTVEHIGEGVGEHERSRHERDARHHEQRDENQPHLAGEQVLEGDPDHGSVTQ